MFRLQGLSYVLATNLSCVPGVFKLRLFMGNRILNQLG